MRIVEGTIKFQYDMDADEGMVESYGRGASRISDDEKITYFTERMVDDIIDYAYSDLAPTIEMSIKNV